MDWLTSVRQLSLPVYVCVMFFGISSWIDINGIFVELPLMVNELPEGWDLPSYITLIIQVRHDVTQRFYLLIYNTLPWSVLKIANVGPIAYLIAIKLFPTRVKEWPVIYLIMSVGATSCLLLVFFWDYTTYFGQFTLQTRVLTSDLAHLQMDNA